MIESPLFVSKTNHGTDTSLRLLVAGLVGSILASCATQPKPTFVNPGQAEIRLCMKDEEAQVEVSNEEPNIDAVKINISESPADSFENLCDELQAEVQKGKLSSMMKLYEALVEKLRKHPVLNSAHIKKISLVPFKEEKNGTRFIDIAVDLDGQEISSSLEAVDEYVMINSKFKLRGSKETAGLIKSAYMARFLEYAQERIYTLLYRGLSRNPITPAQVEKIALQILESEPEGWQIHGIDPKTLTTEVIEKEGKYSIIYTLNGENGDIKFDISVNSQSPLFAK